jgi:predicted nucleic acid-binding protein
VAECFLDTNVLLYAVSTHPPEAEKTRAARELVQAADWAWSAQVATEFIRASTSPRQPKPLVRAEARRWIETWMAFPMTAVDGPLVLELCKSPNVFKSVTSTRKSSPQRSGWAARRCIPRI